MGFFNAPPAPAMSNAPHTPGLCESGLVPAVLIVGFFLTIIMVGSLIHYNAVMNAELCEGDTITVSHNGGKGKEAVILKIDGKMVTLLYTGEKKRETIDLLVFNTDHYEYKRRWNDISPDLTQPISPSKWGSSRGRETKYNSLTYGIGTRSFRHWLGKKVSDFFFVCEMFLVQPFIPNALEGFVSWLFLFSFTITIPMAFTRAFKGQWEFAYVTQMFLPNFISRNVFGCAKFGSGDVTAIHYAKDAIPDDQGYSLFRRINETYHARPDPNELGKDPGVDLAIGLHLSCGIIWLCFSCYQIFMAQRGWSNNVGTRHKSHRIFGYCAAATFCCHMVGATNILLIKDLARHVSPVKAALGSDIVVSIIYIFGGIHMQKKAKEMKDKEKFEEYEKYHFIHKLLMVYGFIQSIEGSGTIRFTTWWLSAVTELLPEKLRFYVDSTQCQDNAMNGVCFPITNEMQCTSSSRGHFTLAMDARTKDLSCCAPKTYAGAATFCWYSYLTRLIFMRLLTLYFKAIFLRLPDVKIWLTKVTANGNETTENHDMNENKRREIHNEFKDDLYDEYVREWTYCGFWIIGGAFYLRFNYLFPFIQDFDNAFADAVILALSGGFFAFDTFARIALIAKHLFSDDNGSTTKRSRFIDEYLKGNYWQMLMILFGKTKIE